MKKILKTFLRVNRAGDRIYEKAEELVDDEIGTITTSVKEKLATCRSCGQVVEPNQARINCPICGGTCCVFCHEERLKLEKRDFERQVILERERLRWLESKIFDNFPGIGAFRLIKGIHSIRKLESSRRKLLGR